MHKSSYREMKRNVDRYFQQITHGDTVVDIGSYDVNGSYKPLIYPMWRYVGMDQKAGPNVDIVMPGQYDTGLRDSSVYAVISGQTLEHVRNPIKLVQEMLRILVPGGYLLLTAPRQWGEHRYPVDCYRYLPDGMRAVIEEAGGTCIAAYTRVSNILRGMVDCWGIGRK